MFQAAPLPAPTAVPGGMPGSPRRRPGRAPDGAGRKSSSGWGRPVQTRCFVRPPKRGAGGDRDGQAPPGEAREPGAASLDDGAPLVPRGEALTGGSGQPKGSGGALEPPAGRRRLPAGAAGSREPRGGGVGAPLRGPAAGGRVSLAPQPQGVGAAPL